MKKLTLLILIIGLIGILNNVFSQAKNMAEFVKNSSGVLESLEEKLTIANVEYKLINDSRISYPTLVKGYRYLVFSYADDEVEDLDIIVYERIDSKWVKVASDKDEKSTASVIVNCTETKEYKVELRVYKYKEGKDFSRYCLVLAAVKI